MSKKLKPTLEDLLSDVPAWQAALSRAGYAPVPEIEPDEFSVKEYQTYRKLKTEGSAARELRAGGFTSRHPVRLRTGRVGTAYRVAK